MVTRYDKAIVATIGAVVAILNAAGVPVAEALSQSVIAAATALAVLIVPNK